MSNSIGVIFGVRMWLCSIPLCLVVLRAGLLVILRTGLFVGLREWRGVLMVLPLCCSDGMGDCPDAPCDVLRKDTEVLLEATKRGVRAGSFRLSTCLCFGDIESPGRMVFCWEKSRKASPGWKKSSVGRHVLCSVQALMGGGDSHVLTTPVAAGVDAGVPVPLGRKPWRGFPASWVPPSNTPTRQLRA